MFKSFIHSLVNSSQGCVCVPSLGWEFWGTISSLMLISKYLWCYPRGNQSWWTLGKENNVFSEVDSKICVSMAEQIGKSANTEFLHHKRTINTSLGISSSLMGEAQSL